MRYRITVDGNIGERVGHSFPHLETSPEGRHYVIAGEIRDQAELHGVLALIRDLNVTIIHLASA